MFIQNKTLKTGFFTWHFEKLYSYLPQMFGVSQPSYIDENLTDLPELENEDSERLRSFVVSFDIFLETNIFIFFFFRQA